MKISLIAPLLLYFLAWHSTIALGSEAPRQFTRGVNVWRALTLPKRIEADEDKYVSKPYGKSPPSISLSDYQHIKRQGFDFVRLPLDPTPFYSDGANWSELFGQINDAIKDALDSGLSVIVDIHPPTSHKKWNIDRLVASIQSQDDEILAEKYSRLIRMLTALMVAQDISRIAIEPMNEPDIHCSPDADIKVREAFSTIRRIIRKKTKDLRIVYDSSCQSSWKTLINFSDESVLSDPYIIYSFHFYEPFIFTHQGSTWSKNAYIGNIKRFPYFITSAKVEKALQESINTMEPTSPNFQARRKRIESEMRAQSGTPQTSTLINQAFSKVDRWAQRNSIPGSRILLGEFGTLRTTPQSGPSEDDRARWLQDVRTAAENRGFAWAVWEYVDVMGITVSPSDRTLIPSIQSALGLTDE